MKRTMPVIRLALALVYAVIFRGRLHKARITWYIQRTCTDPWQHGYLTGEVTLADFIFGGSKEMGHWFVRLGQSL